MGLKLITKNKRIETSHWLCFPIYCQYSTHSFTKSLFHRRFLISYIFFVFFLSSIFLWKFEFSFSLLQWVFYNSKIESMALKFQRNIWNKVKKFNKIVNRTSKLRYLFLRVFWLLFPKFNFWKDAWTLGNVSTQIWDFSNIS